MATKNPITGDELRSKVSTDQYRTNFDKIFGAKKNEQVQREESEHECPCYQQSETD